MDRGCDRGGCKDGPGNETWWKTCLDLGVGLGMWVMDALGLGGSGC